MTLVGRFSDGCGLFEFDIATPLFQQLALDFDLLAPVALQDSNLESVEERPGIYGLHYNDSVVYIGKADDSAKSRLGKHRRQLLRKSWDLAKRDKLSLSSLCAHMGRIQARIPYDISLFAKLEFPRLWT